MTQRDLKTAYLHYLDTHGDKPTSLAAFVAGSKVQEQEFHEHFLNMEMLESSIWRDIADFAIKVTNERPNYGELDAKEKTKTFMYNVFNILVGTKLFAVASIRSASEITAGLPVFQPMQEFKEVFMKFVEQIVDEAIAGGEQLQANYLGGKSTDVLWLQFSVVLKQWLDDTSEGYLDTISAIEGGVEYAFERLRENPDAAAQNFMNFLRGKSN